MKDTRKEIVSYFENMSLFVTGLMLLVFPLIFLSTTTDAFTLPKQIVLIGGTTLALILLGLKTIAEGKLRIKNSPFDIPVFLLLFISLLSAIFSTNRADALIAFVPFLFVGLLYFALVNLIKGERQLLFVLSALTLGAVLSALLTIFSFFKIYPLPFAYTHVTFFTTFGSLLDQAIYLALVLPVSGYFAFVFISSLLSGKKSSFATTRYAQNKFSGSLTTFTAASIIITLALALTVYMLVTTQKPLILPIQFGLQTAFASISQDSLQVIKSLLLGSGVGTYLNDFTRYKAATYNADPNLWAFTFFRSSTYVLELLSTTGVLGIAAFLFLTFKVIKEREFFLPLVFALIAAFILPFSFTILTLFFILLAILAAVLIHSNPEKYGEMDFYLVALKKGLLAVSPDGERVHQSPAERRYSKILPITSFIILLVIIGVPFYWAVRFTISDFVFQQSLIAASQNNGLQTYNLQTSAIKIFQYRDIYYRSFAQTNLALANSLAVSQQKESKPNQQVQQNILTLIQQSITAGRNATTIAPLTSFNWNNLSSIYRSLIGFGQNADQFTVLTAQQAIALDPNNPQQYIDLGGVYYQLGSYDDAIRQFQLAINLKKDYANAYYNLGHALEMKGDLQNAMAAYQAVRTLVADNKDNVKRIDADIATLQKKAEEKDKTVKSTSPDVKPSDTDQAIDVNKPTTTLPERDPQVKIPAPTVSPTKAAPTPTSVPQP
jgi:hypothetical protein